MLVGIDIFSGAGGLSLGAEMAGVHIAFAVENNKSAAETYRFNHPNTLVLCADIHDINPVEHLPQLNPDDQLIVFGGPPCQGFSTSNTVTRNMQNPNNSLFEEFVRFVSVLNPDWFLFENVEGFMRFEKGKIRNLVKKCFEDLGYQVSDALLTASDYGVPQTRRRVLMLGVKGKSNTCVNRLLSKINEAATHHNPMKPAIGKHPWVTLREAFEGIPVTEPWKEWNASEETLKRLEIEVKEEETY